jgi:RIO kinase 1
MKIPKRIRPLIDDGVVDEVISQLMGGKEATVYIVRVGKKHLCAKVYKEADQRSFKHAAQYQEGRKGRNSRRARAIQKGSKYGREEQEQGWQTAEVDALFKLASAGVRVPEPFACINGVLLMELITDKHGHVAPRLNDITLSKEQAIADHSIMMDNIVRMLCVGLVHSDLSEFNVLLDEHGPVIIDLPQAIDAAANNQAKMFFTRDVNNITRYYASFAPQLKNTHYAGEIWSLYENGDLHPEVKLTGKFTRKKGEANVKGVISEIDAAEKEEFQRRARTQPSNTSGSGGNSHRQRPRRKRRY